MDPRVDEGVKKLTRRLRSGHVDPGVDTWIHAGVDTWIQEWTCGFRSAHADSGMDMEIITICYCGTIIKIAIVEALLKTLPFL